MAGLAIVADRIEQPAEAGALQAEQNQRADDEPQEEVDRDQPEHLSRAQRLDDFGDMRLARHHVLAVDDHHAAGHEAGAERHDERLHAQERHADPVDDPDHDAEQKRKADRRDGAQGGVGREQVGRSGRHARDRKVDAAGQHHHRLSAADDGERRREQNGVRGPKRRHRPRPHQLDADDEKHQQQDQRIDRARAQETEDRAHLRSCR